MFSLSEGQTRTKCLSSTRSCSVRLRNMSCIVSSKYLTFRPVPLEAIDYDNLDYPDDYASHADHWQYRDLPPRCGRRLVQDLSLRGRKIAF